MPFKKGHSGNPSGKPKGIKARKTLEWEKLGDAILTKDTERFKKILSGLPDDKFIDMYLKILEYFKPKQNRVDNISSDGSMTPTQTIITTLTENEFKERLKK